MQLVCRKADFSTDFRLSKVSQELKVRQEVTGNLSEAVAVLVCSAIVPLATGWT